MSMIFLKIQLYVNGHSKCTLYGVFITLNRKMGGKMDMFTCLRYGVHFMILVFCLILKISLVDTSAFKEYEKYTHNRRHDYEH